MRQGAWSFVTLVFASVVFSSGVAFGGPLRCHVIEHSDTGGTVEVLTDETLAPAWWPEGNKPQIVWRPAPAPMSPRLTLKFANSTLAEMGRVPSGGYIRFRIPPPTQPDDTQVILDLPTESVVFKREQLKYGRDFGSDDETQPAMDIVFPNEDWSAIKAAITEGGRLSVKLIRKGQALSDTTFDLGNWDARDALLAKAARRVAAADPKACTTASIPVIDMTSQGTKP
ncbi:hypothetical protein [Asticcacaulis sp.]|uniref:hypothetical protein n=1 Tax=Asticcacaulis sp. TaxID=1872648 RepID=UPI003F7B7175